MTREEALKTWLPIILGGVKTLPECKESLEMAIKALEQEPILDKIRAEIEQTAKDYDAFDDYRRVRGLWIALDIIDKYRQEGA